MISMNLGAVIDGTSNLIRSLLSGMAVTMLADNLGTLIKVDVREAWPDEAQDFTPWLADNLQRLAEVLRIDLELEDTEVHVQEFQADIVARVPQDGSVALIENQLEQSDHRHLGQIMTYLAGTGAQTVVWIASGFSPAHLSAVRWLNENTVDPFAFFAVRLGVVRIGDSLRAPTFEVLEQPNEWDRRIRAASHRSDISEIGQLRRDFWDHYSRRKPGSLNLRTGYRHSNVWHWVEEAELVISQYVAQGQVGLYVRGHMGVSEEITAQQIEPFDAALR